MYCKNWIPDWQYSGLSIFLQWPLGVLPLKKTECQIITSLFPVYMRPCLGSLLKYVSLMQRRSYSSFV